MQVALIKHDFITKDVCIEVSDNIKDRDLVVVESSRGILVAQVIKVSKDYNAELDSETKFLRLASEEDLKKDKELQNKAMSVKDVIVKFFNKHNSDMKLVDIKYVLDDTKVVISFVCEERVDFRELVKELASELKTRIELRQVGIRDQAKKVGCLGICGKECCCKQYLNDFDKVSIKMAKTQNLSLNPTKISGTCGRLMCCLAFENDTYAELSKNCPKINAKVSTPEGKGVVLAINILKQTCSCKIEKGDDVKVAEYPISSIKTIKDFDKSE